MVHMMFYIFDLYFVHSELYLGFYAQNPTQLLLWPLVCFLLGPRWVLSHKILFLIPSLAILSWISSFA